MTQIKTPAEIARDSMTGKHWEAVDPHGVWQEASEPQLIAAIVAAIEADRAQRQPEIYIVQGEDGDVLALFRDRGEAEAASAPSLDRGMASVIEETVTEPGEYAEPRIAELTAKWEDAVNYGREDHEELHRASDYALSGDDWRTGLADDDADEIARLIEWREGQK